MAGRGRGRADDVAVGQGSVGVTDAHVMKKAKNVWSVSLVVLPPVFKDKELFVSSSSTSVTEVSIESDKTLIDLRERIILAYFENNMQDGVDTKMGKLFYTSDSRNLRMTDITGPLVLIEAFDKVKKDKTKLQRIAVGALPADADQSTAPNFDRGWALLY
jgi:hypothetical protein